MRSRGEGHASGITSRASLRGHDSSAGEGQGERRVGWWGCRAWTLGRVTLLVVANLGVVVTGPGPRLNTEHLAGVHRNGKVR